MSEIEKEVEQKKAIKVKSKSSSEKLNKKPIFHLVQVSRESGILGLKNENPCFENFSGVLGSWLYLGEGEESQRFPKVNNSKYENRFLTMSSPDPRLSRTIFIFTIERIEIKIFHF
jgi:hypothetical protein